jgi:hypothetical protein
VTCCEPVAVVAQEYCTDLNLSKFVEFIAISVMEHAFVVEFCHFFGQFLLLSLAFELLQIVNCGSPARYLPSSLGFTGNFVTVFGEIDWLTLAAVDETYSFSAAIDVYYPPVEHDVINRRCKCLVLM